MKNARSRQINTFTKDNLTFTYLGNKRYSISNENLKSKKPFLLRFFQFKHVRYSNIQFLGIDYGKVLNFFHLAYSQIFTSCGWVIFLLKVAIHFIGVDSMCFTCHNLLFISHSQLYTFFRYQFTTHCT